jgi:hypothetical protein
MKPNRNFLWGMLTSLLLVVLLATAFGVGTAFAATGCFLDTNGHIYETAICWLKANGIVSGTIFSPNTAATRATVAQWLYKQSQIPPTQGLIYISAGNNTWQKGYFSESTYFDNFPTNLVISKPDTGNGLLFLEPTLPLSLYGRSLKLLGVEFCYDASTDVQLYFAYLSILSSTTGIGQSTEKFSDATIRTDNACRYYALPAPYTLTNNDSVVFNLYLHWMTAGYPFYISRTTFVLKPTGDKVGAPGADLTDTVILTEGAGGEEPIP